MSKVVGYLISDIMGDTTLSGNWNTQRDPQNRHFVEQSTPETAGIHLVSWRKHNDQDRTDGEAGHILSLPKLYLGQVLLRPLAKGIEHLSALSDEITEW